MHLLIVLSFVGFVVEPLDGYNSSTFGHHLRVVYSHNPPYDFITKSRNGTSKFQGTGALLADWWSRRFKITTSFVHATDEHVKRRGINAAADLLIQNEGDVTATPFGVTADRLQIIDFCSFPAWQESFRLVVPRPGEELRLFAIIRPFDNMVWLLIVISFPITVIIMSLLSLSKLVNSDTSKRETFTEYIGIYSLYTFKVFTNHGDYLKMTGRISFVIFVSFWLLGASVLVYVYSSIVITSLTVPKLNPPVNSFEDLLKSNDVSLLLRTDLYWGLRIMNSKSGILKQLAVKVQSQPESLTNDPAELDKRLATGKFAYPFAETFVRIFIASQHKKDGRCRFQESDVLQEANLFYYSMVPRFSKIGRPLSLSFIEMWESGILEKWKKDLLPPRVIVCLAEIKKIQPIAQTSSIKLDDLTSAFFVLGIGCSLSLILLFFEIVANCSNKVEKRKSLTCAGVIQE